MSRIRTQGNWGQITDDKLVEKLEPGVWRGNCPWDGCAVPVSGEDRGEALERIADHILEDHA